MGIVSCRDVPLTRMPQALNTSKVFMLRLENNGLTWIEPQLLQATGLYRLHISDNPLPELPEDSLLGLERSLWELALQRDKLIAVPSRALRHLQKLRLLDLTGNDICELMPDSFRGLESSLQALVLADNSISMLPPNAFSEMRVLETLDLRGNLLTTLDSGALPPRIQHLSLSDNMLHIMPMAALRTGLRSLDLSRNRLTRLFPDDEDDSVENNSPSMARGGAGNLGGQQQRHDSRISLDVLRLEYNQITELPEASFRAFSVVNTTFFDGNPIMAIHANAFREARIQDLSLRDCSLSHLPLNVFSGLEESLQHLDLSANNLTMLPPGLLGNLRNLRGLDISDNKMTIDPEFMKRAGVIEEHAIVKSNRNTNNHGNGRGEHRNLHRLDVSGKDMRMNKDLAAMMESWGSLRVLSLGRLQSNKLSPEDLKELSPDVEELNLVSSGIHSIAAHAFQHARGVKRLDLSENSIKTIEDEAFSEVGHTLDFLRMHRALNMDQVPVMALRPLTGTRELDLSGNGLKSIIESSFHNLRNLRRLRLHDNQLGRIPKDMLHAELHSYLEEADFSFNAIDHVHVDTFSGLASLRQIRLDDNRIGSIEPRSFADLPRLRQLQLRGNRLTSLNPETFQNLPDLEELDLAFNKLQNLDLAALDQVGTLASLKFNASHNNIKELRPLNNGVATSNGVPANLHINVKIMDLSHNNITEISGGYFRPIEAALTQLLLCHNGLVNATREAFGNMPHLQWLDLSFNRLRELDFDVFRHTRRLQVLKLQYNDLVDVPADVFHGLNELRVITLADNGLKQLPDGLVFAATNLERLDVSNNQLTRVPNGIFSASSGRSLCDLDLSHNLIAAIHPTDAVSRLKSLTRLDLSHNRLTRLDDATFSTMPRLTSLDISYNPLDETALSSPLAALESCPRLMELGLAGLGLDVLPSLPPLPTLRDLLAQENLLPMLPSDLAANLTGLRLLDVRDNSLNTLGQVGHGGGLLLPQLRSLRLAGNPLVLISDACLATATRLGELDLRNLTQISAIEFGALSKMSLLRTLRLGTYHAARDFNIPRLVRHNHALKSLYIEVDEKEKELSEKMAGMQLPTKLSAVHIAGRSLKSISANLLNGIRSPRLHLELRNTSLESLQKAFFQQLGRARNITLDVRNNTLRSIANPNTADHPGDRRDCQYGAEDDMRDAHCDNKSNQTLIEVLKNDLECGWASAATVLAARQLVALVPAILLSALAIF
ncbi:hypothetical protein B566_EDAN015132 [Ephemera danica]|nr:hypothetical protein B566_EDAN015132 [Ephemera danica]